MLRFGEAYDDPLRKLMDHALQRAGGDRRAAADALWNLRERKRKANNMLGGGSVIQMENQQRGLGGIHDPGDTKLRQASTMLNNLAVSGGKTAGNFSEAPRQADPRLSTQGRNEYGRMAQAALAEQTRRSQQAQSQAESDRQRLAERQRMATEGDAWVADQRQKSQALLALGTRGARDY